MNGLPASKEWQLIVHNIRLDTFSYMQMMNSWHAGRAVGLFLTPYRKRSLLHDLASHVIEEMMPKSAEARGTCRLAKHCALQRLQGRGGVAVVGKSRRARHPPPPRGRVCASGKTGR